MNFPKIKKFDTKIATPKIAIPRLNFVSHPQIGSAKGAMSKVVKTKIKLK